MHICRYVDIWYIFLASLRAQAQRRNSENLARASILMVYGLVNHIHVNICMIHIHIYVCIYTYMYTYIIILYIIYGVVNRLSKIWFCIVNGFPHWLRHRSLLQNKDIFCRALLQKRPIIKFSYLYSEWSSTLACKLSLHESRCSVLQCVAVCCRVLTSEKASLRDVQKCSLVAVCCRVLQYRASKKVYLRVVQRYSSSSGVAVCCGALQCAAVCCSIRTSTISIWKASRGTPLRPVLQCVAVCSALQCVPVYEPRQILFERRPEVLLFAQCCSVLQCVAVCCSVLQCDAVCCSVCTIFGFWKKCTWEASRGTPLRSETANNRWVAPHDPLRRTVYMCIFIYAYMQLVALRVPPRHTLYIYIWKYICVYTHIHIYVYVYVNTYIYTYVYIYIYIYTCIYIYIHM